MCDPFFRHEQTLNDSFTPRRIKGKEIPAIRDELVGWLQRNKKLDAAEEEEGINLRQSIAAIAKAELFHVSREFCDLIAAAHDSMPAHVLTQFDPPTRSGFVMVSDPNKTNNPRHFGDVAGWFWVTRTDGLILGPLSDRRSHPHPTGGCRYIPFLRHFSWGDTFDSKPWDPSQVSEEEASALRMSAGRRLHVSNLVVFWNLLRQDALTETEIEKPPLAEQRHLKRLKRKVPAIRMISLPGSRAASSPDVKNDREWQHRWIVRGHWRRQWYPSIRGHRPVWISPHIKGPEDAPLIGGQKVYSVKPPKAKPLLASTRDGA